MPINRQREKLIDAILFFRENTTNFGITKLFKLLFILDFAGFAKLGRSVTGLRYETWDFGPAPAELWTEVQKAPRPDLAAAVTFQNLTLDEDRRQTRIDAKRKFDGRHFNAVEKELLRNIAEIYREATAKQMVEVTHVEKSPWAKTLQSKGRNAEIDYMLALDGSSRDQLSPQQMKEIYEDLVTSEAAP